MMFRFTNWVSLETVPYDYDFPRWRRWFNSLGIHTEVKRRSNNVALYRQGQDAFRGDERWDENNDE